MSRLNFFRYAGGKQKLITFILPKIENYFQKNQEYKTYIEPFFGGGSIGLSLLENPNIDNYILNDIDVSLICLWQSVQFYKDKLIDKIKSYKPTVEDFFSFKKNLLNVDKFPNNKNDLIQCGFEKLVIHQISFSGLGTKSGSPLGGINQNSNYKIDCRWSVNNLIKKINKVNEILSKKNVQFTCNNILKDKFQIKKSFFYFDPPYLEKGQELYQYAFNENNHIELKSFIEKLDNNWLLSYDNHDNILEIYKNYKIELLDANYTINTSTKKKEILIYPK